MDRTIRNVLVDDRIEEYHDYFPTECAKEFGEHAASSAVLQELTDDLLLSWRSATYAASMPSQLAYTSKASIEGYKGLPATNTQLLELADATISGLSQSASELDVEPSLRRTLHQAVVDLGARFRETQSPVEVSLENSWRQYLNCQVFVMSLASSQSQCFQEVYNGYERFLVQCVAVANRLSKCRSTDRDFRDHLDTALGKGIRTECWTAPSVNRLRLIRHALAHSDGYVTDDIRNQSVSVRTLGDSTTAIASKC